ncbi:hypothetical protein P7K49_016197 [Saguinus oedipus]|uniref:Uncharacterized protein n=1 Tax=Saguinus oedipus TaxID=9490 RepID=A0ABQ9VBC8_SAGOE|nr:hypothetical protein P7K49_016197 [Saguinus oedipus]
MMNGSTNIIFNQRKSDVHRNPKKGEWKLLGTAGMSASGATADVVIKAMKMVKGQLLPPRATCLYSGLVAVLLASLLVVGTFLSLLLPLNVRHDQGATHTAMGGCQITRAAES